MRYAIFSGQSNPILNIDSIGYSADPAVTRFGPSRRNQYIIHYCISGRGFFNGEPISAKQGFLITPGMDEVYYSEDTDPWAFLWIISEDKKMRDIFTALQPTPKSNIFSFENLQDIMDIADFTVTNSNQFFTSSELLEMFLKLLKPQLNRQKHQGQSHVQTYVNAAVNYIKANLYRPIFIHELTDFLGISQPYLFKIFQAEFGCSPKQYILDNKLEYAKQLLTGTDLSVTQVATAVGFDDVLSFSKFFSARMGISPKNYRK